MSRIFVSTLHRIRHLHHREDIYAVEDKQASGHYSREVMHEPNAICYLLYIQIPSINADPMLIYGLPC